MHLFTYPYEHYAQSLYEGQPFAEGKKNMANASKLLTLQPD